MLQSWEFSTIDAMVWTHVYYWTNCCFHCHYYLHESFISLFLCSLSINIFLHLSASAVFYMQDVLYNYFSQSGKPERDNCSVSNRLRFRVGIIAVIAACRLQRLGCHGCRCLTTCNSVSIGSSVAVCIGEVEFGQCCFQMFVLIGYCVFVSIFMIAFGLVLC